MRLYDTHCHLDATFDEPVDALLTAARAAGVGAIVLPAVSPETWEGSIAVARAWPEVRLALGIHPQVVRDLSDPAIDEALHALPELLRRTNAVAVGEIGLDHLQDRDPALRERQRRVFLAQLDIAADLALPPLIHCLKAHGPLRALWSAHRCRQQVPGVLHSYSGSAELARYYVQDGLYLSFSGAITFPKARRAPVACRVVPDARLLIETDAPYQPPHPLDGRPNRPARLVEVARAVAALRDTSVPHVAEQTWRNAEALFG